MASEMIEALIQLCQDKHIDELYLLDRLEQSLAESYAKLLKLDWGAKVTIDRATGNIYVYKLEPVDESMDEEGNYTEFNEIDVTPKDTSRAAARAAKDEISAIVRNAARQEIYEEFSHRVGDIITGTVLQSTPDFTIVKIREGVEAELPHFDRKRFPDERNERPNGERYSHNQRLKAIIIDVRDPNSTMQPVRGERSRPSIVISRTHPDLIVGSLSWRSPRSTMVWWRFAPSRVRLAYVPRWPSPHSTTASTPWAPALALRVVVCAPS